MGKFTDEHRQQALQMLKSGSSQAEVSQLIGVSKRTLSEWSRIDREGDSKDSSPEPIASVPINPDIPEEELVKRLIDDYNRRDEYEKKAKLIDVEMPDDLPFGISFFGDPHLGDAGTNMPKLVDDLETVRDTEAMYGVNIGDVTNNWVGRLERLYGDQRTTKADEVRLCRWFIKHDFWLAHIIGNHDAWNNGKFLIKEFAKGTKAVHVDEQVALRFKFPNGSDITLLARHDFKGNSQWNPMHGVMKAAQFGQAYDILANGHTHVSGYGQTKCQMTGRVSHALQLSAYKEYDKFAKEKGFRDQNMFNNAVAIIDPTREGIDRVRIRFNVQDAARELVWLRDEAKKKSANDKATKAFLSRSRQGR